MRRSTVFVVLALLVLLGLGGAYFFLQGQPTLGRDAAPTSLPMVEIVVAKQNIPQGAEITEDVLGSISVPEATFAASMIRYDQRETVVVGKAAKYPLDQGTPIGPSMIGALSDIVGKGPSWAINIPAGMTAVSIPTNQLSSVAYGAADGAHVNVVACFSFVDIDAGFQTELPNGIVAVGSSGYPIENPNLTATVGAYNGSVQGRIELDPTLQQPIYVVGAEQQRPRPVCQTILQDAIVLKLGEFPLGEENEDGAAATTPAAAEGTGTAPDAAANEAAAIPLPEFVTLIVSPQDATALTYLTYSGADITLTLRRTDDTRRINTEATTLQFLLSQYAIPVPAKLPYAPANPNELKTQDLGVGQ